MPNYLSVSCSVLTYNCIKYIHLKYYFQIIFRFFKMELGCSSCYVLQSSKDQGLKLNKFICHELLRKYKYRKVHQIPKLL